MPTGFLGKIRTMFGGHNPAAKKVIERQPRYVMEVSVIYRPTGGNEWHKGKTENLSSTGVLFHGDIPVPLNTAIEMNITPPASSPRRIQEGIFCWGTVVRTAAPGKDVPHPVLAAKILKFRAKPKFLSDADIHFERIV